MRRTMATSDEWTLVTARRRKYPSTWMANQHPYPSILTNPYRPFALSYAQAVKTISAPNSIAASPNCSTPSSPRPSSTPPTSPKSTSYYVSPHIPTHLRFPPSPSFSEWRGKCFRCCRTGHTKATCRNQKRCGKCWKSGHIGSRCTITDMVPPSGRPISKSSNTTAHEPLFDDLLIGPLPANPQMSENRPFKTTIFIPRDERYFEELGSLKQAVVLNTHEPSTELSPDTVANYAARTGLVTQNEVSIAILTRGRYLIHLPPMLAPERFIKATPHDLWDLGFTFQPWSPHEEAYNTISSYKLLLEIVNLPPVLWREEVIKQAVANFGIFLGTVASPDPCDLKKYLAVVATDNLLRVSERVTLMVGGLEYMLNVNPIKWVHGLIYKLADLPPTPKIFHQPDPPTPPSSSSSDEGGREEGDDIVISGRVLLEIVKDRDRETLPPQLREMVEKAEAWQFSNSAGTIQERMATILDRMATEIHCP